MAEGRCLFCDAVEQLDESEVACLDTYPPWDEHCDQYMVVCEQCGHLVDEKENRG